MRSKDILDLTRVLQYHGLYSFSALDNYQIQIESKPKEFYITLAPPRTSKSLYKCRYQQCPSDLKNLGCVSSESLSKIVSNLHSVLIRTLKNKRFKCI